MTLIFNGQPVELVEMFPHIRYASVRLEGRHIVFGVHYSDLEVA